jgi:hypothetical protein
MFRRTTAAAAAAIVAGGMLALGALPATAATRDAASTRDAAAHSSVHTFGIPGVYGISAWGSYEHAGGKVRVTVCVKDSAHGVYGGAAAGIAYDGSRRQVITAVTIGYRHTGCQTMTTRYTNHLVVDAVSGWPNGKVRQTGRVRQVY